MHRESGGETFMEALAPARLGRNAQLERIAALVDWAPLAEIVSVVYAAPRGRPAYPPLLMVKALLLGEWYDLSDEELEAVLWDRLSFRRFVGLGLQADAPDRATVSRFRRQLARRGLAPRLFAALNRQLPRRGGWWSNRARCWTPPWSRRRCAARARPPARAGEPPRPGRQLDAQARPRVLRLPSPSGRGPGVGPGPPG